MSKLRRPRLNGSAAVQSDVRDARWCGCRRKLCRISTARNRAVDLRPVQKHSRSVAQEVAFRNRANRKSLSQRNQSAQFHISFTRVRADGAGIFLPTRAGNGVARVLERRAPEVL